MAEGLAGRPTIVDKENPTHVKLVNEWNKTSA